MARNLFLFLVPLALGIAVVAVLHRQPVPKVGPPVVRRLPVTPPTEGAGETPALRPPDVVRDPNPAPKETAGETPVVRPLHPRPEPPLPRGPETPPATRDGKEIKWEAAYKDSCDDPASAKKYYVQDGEVTFHEKHKALLLHAGDQSRQVFAVVHQSLPGDLRVRFRALRRKQADDVSIGIIFGVRGGLKGEDGYFAEWAGGNVHLKKQNIEQVRFSAATPQTPDRWVNLELRKAGATITLFTEGKQVLTWTDPQPPAGAEYDMLSFYVWNESTLVKDLVIERNGNDPVKPQAEDPANKYRMLGIARPVDDQPPPSDF